VRKASKPVVTKLVPTRKLVANGAEFVNF
jgi:hypothetical protein